MKLKSICIISVLLAFCLILGCATPPTDEMNNAIEAVTRAENDADAVLYGSISLDRARDTLRRMQTEANSKRYNIAKTLAGEAVAAADRAIAEGQAGSARAREEAAALLAGLRPMIAETGQNLNSARSVGLLVDYTELDREFDDACFKTDQAEIALAEKQYQNAMEKGRSARADLSDINQKLAGAAISVARKK